MESARSRPFAARRSYRCDIVRAMPRDGSLVLSDVRAPTLTIVCEPCGRRRQYNVARLLEKHGDTKILYLVNRLANCPKAQSINIYDRCKARYEGLTTRQRSRRSVHAQCL